jgi:hypothetical protein
VKVFGDDAIALELYQANSCHDGEKVWARKEHFRLEIRKALDKGQSRHRGKPIKTETTEKSHPLFWKNIQVAVNRKKKAELG